MNNRNIAIVAIVGVVVLGAIILLLLQGNFRFSTEVQVPVESFPVISPPPDTATNINQELNQIDIGDLDSEFHEIDADLDTLQ